MMRRIRQLFSRKKKTRRSNGSSPRRVPVLDSGSLPKGGGAKPKSGGGRKKRPNALKRAWQTFTDIIRALLFPVGAILAAIVLWFLLSLPDIETLNESTKKQSVVIKSDDGQIVASYGDIYGDFISFEELPQSLIDAVLATEDRNFYHHIGVDPFGLARAITANVQAGKTVQGGSTITQQVAKNVFLTPERTLTRKIREALLAFKLEMRFSKKDIMAIYLNRVYLGSGNFGVDAAAKRYFDKSARDLTLSESAIIAGLLKAPSRYSPTNNSGMAKKRGEQIILNMVDAGFLKPKEAENAKQELEQTISRTERNTAESSMYFGDWIMDQLPEFVGNVGEDLIVTSTLSPRLQHIGEEAIAKVMDERGESLNASQAAIVSMVPDGAVRVMIGGRNYSKSPYNRAVQAKRQPGSSFKLFVYLAGLEAGLTPSSTVIDQPVSVGKWQPKNYTGDYKGEMPLRDAVAQSINSVAVQVSEYVGRYTVVKMAQRLGITSELNPDPSLALGSNEVTLLELTTAYAHLAAGGRIVIPYGILEIKTSSGKSLYRRQPPSGGQALNEGVVGMMNSMLMGVVNYGTGRGAAIGRQAAGKTGTTSDYRDAWFIGYTPDLATGVWVGNDDNSAMKKVTGGTLPAPIWRDFMSNALAGVPAKSLPVSSGFWQSILPWQSSDDSSNAPMGGSAAQRREQGDAVSPAVIPRPAPQPQGGDEDVILGPSFWNKLMGE